MLARPMGRAGPIGANSIAEIIEIYDTDETGDAIETNSIIETNGDNENNENNANKHMRARSIYAPGTRCMLRVSTFR